MTGVEGERKKDREKDCIYAFLIEYQEKRKNERDFLKLMHSLSTLSRMLRKSDEEENDDDADALAGTDVDVVPQFNKNSIAEEGVDTSSLTLNMIVYTRCTVRCRLKLVLRHFVLACLHGTISEIWWVVQQDVHHNSFRLATI
jgi:hypothetical protein